jgi:hypothetical protein
MIMIISIISRSGIILNVPDVVVVPVVVIVL